MNPEPPTTGAGDAIAPPEVVADLASSDPDRVTRSLRTLVPLALEKVQERFGLRKLRAADLQEAEGALWSAWSSFRRHYRDEEFVDARTPEELAYQLLRIAQNRAQRKRRQEERLRDELRHGMTRDQDGHPVPRQYEDNAPGPEQQALLNEFFAYLGAVIDSIKEELRDKSGKTLAIIEAYLQDMDRSQTTIAEDLGVNQSTVSRHLEWFHYRIRQMLDEATEP